MLFGLPLKRVDLTFPLAYELRDLPLKLRRHFPGLSSQMRGLAPKPGLFVLKRGPFRQDSGTFGDDTVAESLMGRRCSHCG
jgi:hypothetical protein